MKFLKELYDEFPEKTDIFSDEMETSGTDDALDPNIGEIDDSEEKDEFDFDIDSKLTGHSDEDLEFPEDDVDDTPEDPVDLPEPTETKGKFDDFLALLTKFIEYHQNKDSGAEFPNIDGTPDDISGSDGPSDDAHPVSFSKLPSNDTASFGDVADDIGDDVADGADDMSQLPPDIEDGDDNGLKFDDSEGSDEIAAGRGYDSEEDEPFDIESPDLDDGLDDDSDDDSDERNTRYPF